MNTFLIPHPTGLLYRFMHSMPIFETNYTAQQKFSTDFFFVLILHSRYMKTQQKKFKILNERLYVFKCNLIQLNFVQNILVIGRICNANFHPFGDVRNDVTRSFDAAKGKLGN